jgi:hypothetical protein
MGVVQHVASKVVANALEESGTSSFSVEVS